MIHGETLKSSFSEEVPASLRKGWVQKLTAVFLPRGLEVSRHFELVSFNSFMAAANICSDQETRPLWRLSLTLHELAAEILGS